MDNDAQLLRRFVEEGSEAAFTELVRRHIDTVYSAALRRVGGDAHRAADVTQQVFIALARQAPQLVRHTVLSGWLHSATRNLSVNAIVAEQRRRAREVAAVALAGADHEPAPAWEQVRPVLDAAIDELPVADRSAIVLRFLERRPFAEIGSLLNLSADAARMRTERALEKLRAVLARQGITSTAAALGALVSAQAGGAAPSGLAASVTPAALAGTAGASAVAATTFIVSIKTIITAASIAAALGLGFYIGAANSVQQPLPPLPPTPEHVQAIAALRRDNQSLKAEVDRLTAANAALTAAATARPAPPAAPVPRAAAAAMAAPLPALTRVNQQRAIMNNLRQVSAARDQFILEYKRPPMSLDELVGPTKYIRALNPVAGESYAALSLAAGQPLTVAGPDGAPLTYDPTGSGTTDLAAAARTANEEAQRILSERFGAEFVQRMRGAIQKAGAAYAAANGGKSPTNVEAVLPYFSTPQEGADFVEFSEAAKALGLKF
jgi:RNA polymerase sigma factor (sigma-70 family)